MPYCHGSGEWGSDLRAFWKIGLVHLDQHEHCLTSPHIIVTIRSARSWANIIQLFSQRIFPLPTVKPVSALLCQTELTSSWRLSWRVCRPNVMLSVMACVTQSRVHL